MRFRCALGEKVFGETLASEGRGNGWKRLFFRGDFAGNVAGRIWLRLEREKWFAGDAIEEIDETLFGSLRDGVDRFAVALHGEQYGGRGKIAVPDIVMDALKMPEAFSGAGVESDQAVGEEVVADAIGAVKIEAAEPVGT